MASKSVQYMETREYLNLVAAYQESFRNQEESEINSRIRKCEVECAKTGAFSASELRRSAQARRLISHYYAMEDAKRLLS